MQALGPDMLEYGERRYDDLGAGAVILEGLAHNMLAGTHIWTTPDEMKRLRRILAWHEIVSNGQVYACQQGAN